MSEKDLLNRAIDGDADALSLLLEEHTQAVRNRLAGRISKQWQSLLSEEDVLQQTFADAFLDISDFQPQGDGSFAGWLTTVAERNLVDAIRTLEAAKRGGGWKRVSPKPGDDTATVLYDRVTGSTTPSRHAARKEAIDKLTEVLALLSDDHRRVIQMYDLDGGNVEEVATAMGRSVGAVFMLRQRALKELQKHLGGTNPIIF